MHKNYLRSVLHPPYPSIIVKKYSRTVPLTQFSVKFDSMLEFDQSYQSLDLLKPCDWSNSRVEKNFTLKFLYRIGSESDF